MNKAEPRTRFNWKGLTLQSDPQTKATAQNALRLSNAHRGHQARGMYPFTSNSYDIECDCGEFVQVTALAVREAQAVWGRARDAARLQQHGASRGTLT
jgi:hypothetical protein